MSPPAGELYAGLEDEGVHGEEVPGPPWILGHRGTPREAPENTLAGLRRAVDIGLDGFEYDLRACASGELVLLHDRTLDRTTDGSGPLSERTLPELFRLDAGGWFARRYVGEPLPVFDEALEIAGDGERWPLHMIELKEPGLVERVAAKLAQLGRGLRVRVAGFRRDVVLEAHRAGLPAMLLAVRADEDDRRWVRDEGIEAYGVGPGGWKSEAGEREWNAERWGWSIDTPEELLAACRAPLFGFNTNEPYRALAVRALVHLAPADRGGYPLEVPELLVEPESLAEEVRARGEWYGSWKPTASIRNPFPWPVEVRCGLFLPSGAFEVEGLPVVFDLDVGQTRRVTFSLTGGSRIPGPDPLLAGLFRWRVGTGSKELRPGGRLLFDAPLVRRRVTSADPLARRLALLRERPSDPPATVILRRRGRDLLLSIEDGGGLGEAHLIAHLNGELVRGGPSLRLFLPSDFDLRGGGIPFSCGIEGRDAGSARLRRWAGGLPEGVGHGAPGLLLPLGQG